MAFLLLAVLTAGLTWRVVLADRLAYSKSQLLLAWLGLTFSAPVTMAFRQGGMDLFQGSRQVVLGGMLLLPLLLIVGLAREVMPSVPAELLLLAPALWYILSGRKARSAHS